jgi:RNA-directed DNA polymerase
MARLTEIKSRAHAHRAVIEKGRLVATMALYDEDLTFEENKASLLLSITHPFQLAQLLRTPFSVLEKVLSHPEYDVFEIPKKRNGKRKITAPLGKTKTVQYRLNQLFQGYYSFIRPAVSYGFIRASSHDTTPPSIVGNAAVHVGKQHLYTLDLKDYFGNITTRQVYRLFTSEVFQFNTEIARAMALFVTYEGSLPTGAPTSPVIANFCTLELDAELNGFARNHGLRYSRYADDLTFSSDEFIPTEARLQLNLLIEAHGFLINQKKVRYRHPHQQHRVTGIIVNEKLNVDRKYLKNTRAMLHDFMSNGIAEATSKHFGFSETRKNDKAFLTFICRLRGRLDFITQVRGKDDPIALKMNTTFSTLMNAMQEQRKAEEKAPNN